MLNLPEILKMYPESLRAYRDFILREYLQHKILQFLFSHPDYAQKMCFIGGTCLRIVHGNTRFSEDLDFDNFSMSESEFASVSGSIKDELEREGYTVEIKNVYKGAFHCYIRFPGLLFQEGLSGHKEQQILIQVDTEPQHFDFHPETHILNKFDVFTEIRTTPLDILLAQKFYAIINRKRSKGRDFYDVVFLLSKVERPNYDYLKLKLGVSNGDALKESIFATLSNLDMNEMSRDVAPFLFNPNDSKKVSLFRKFIEQVKL